MITNIWLKSQPKKKISYPNCYPLITETGILFLNIEKDRRPDAEYSFSSISRIEFRL